MKHQFLTLTLSRLSARKLEKKNNEPILNKHVSNAQPDGRKDERLDRDTWINGQGLIHGLLLFMST